MDRRKTMTLKKSREVERTIYTDWANHHLEKTGVKRVIQDLPKDISDGLLLIDIVQFVCGVNVDRVHSNPSTTKQKLHNIDRCLQVLLANNVVLNDVTAQGLYRGELKCVLALFFHLSRYKQKRQEFKMTEKAPQRRLIKPPSTVTVSRKSRSFNANDRNRISTGFQPNTFVSEPTVNGIDSLSPSSQTTAGWRSKSMSSKHSATTRLAAPKTHSLQTFKPLANGTSPHHPTVKAATPPPSKLGSPSRLRKTTVRTPRATPEPKTKTSAAAPEQSRREAKTMTSSHPRSKLSAPGSLKRPEVLLSDNKSAVSRIRKTGTVTTSTTPTSSVTSPAAVKQRTTSASKTVATSVTSASKKRAESCPPTSRMMTTVKTNSRTAQQSPVPKTESAAKKTSKNTGLKSPTSLKNVKSSIGKALGTKQAAKSTTHVPNHTQGRPVTDVKTNKPDQVSSRTHSTPHKSTGKAPPPPVPRRSDLDALSDSRRTSLKAEDPKASPVACHEPVSISMRSPRPKSNKTATVAPFLRQSFSESSQDPSAACEKPDPATTPSDAREMAVKGIADLRHNLEETMSSLRNTQLRHKKGDAFHRRISAQLDGVEIDDGNLPEIPPPLSYSGSLCRSHHNLLSGRSGSLNSPKQHAGEALGQDSEYRFMPGRFSSLQRTRSARYPPRSAWHEVSNGYVSESDLLADDDKKSFNDASSVDSDISDFIDDISTDSSKNTSPYHQVHKSNENIASLKQNGLSKSTMAIESTTKSSRLAKKTSLGKPPSGKSGAKVAGSSLVGSRLACNTLSQSPTNSSPLQNFAGQRGMLAYRSLPRPSKSRMTDDKTPAMSPLSTMSGISTFKRSPSLQKLSGMNGKVKQDKPTASLSSAPAASTSVSTVDTTASVQSPTPTLKGTESFSTPAKKEHNNFTKTKNSSFGTSPLSYYSLPRKHRISSSIKRSSVEIPTTTISSAQKNPYLSLDILTTPSLYLDDTSTTSVDMLSDVDYRGGVVSDWPLPTLHHSSAKSSNLDTERAAKTPDVSSTTQDLFAQHKNKRSQSLMSSNPSLYSLPEEKASDNSKLKKSPGSDDASLQSQLSSNAKVVSAFEESLSNMNFRLRELSDSAEQKDSELQELRATIESLKRNRLSDEWSGVSSSSGLRKKPSCGSMTSISSKTSISSMGSTDDGIKRKKKKSWLRESLKTAFGKRKSRASLTTDSEEAETSEPPEDNGESEVVCKLREELVLKERKLTDIRLEALSSQHQLHQMQDAMQKMRTEMETLRMENERLNRLGVSSVSLNDDRGSSSCESIVSRDSTKVFVTLQLPSHVIQDDSGDVTTVPIGSCYVTRSVTWQQLDRKLRKVFKEYCETLDPTDGLGLDSSVVTSYTVGEARRCVATETPELLPCGYMIGNVDTITIDMAECDLITCLSLEMLIDKTTLERYTGLVLDHGRVMLSGPAGTGKSTLARGLAEYVVRKVPQRASKTSIVRLDLKLRPENEIREYLQQLSDDCSKAESCGRDIPAVLILDDLHRSVSLMDAFHPLLTAAAHSQLPFLIGVVQRNLCPGLELHQEFRWILCPNHAPPTCDYLARSLRRSLVEWQFYHKDDCDETVQRVVDWLPSCWKHVNSYIESYNSADVTLGPRMFACCPMKTSRDWFRDLWNFSVVPYVISAVKQGQRKVEQGDWIDPLTWVKKTWPWNSSCDNLLPIRFEDVAYDVAATGTSSTSATPQSGDPLLNMLMKLQEAAINYESDTSHDDLYERSLDRALGDLS